MALATRCPNCQVLFRVVADQLKLRGGLVRCGACRHVFDAIGSLTYIEDGAAAAPEPPPVRKAAPPTLHATAVATPMLRTPLDVPKQAAQRPAPPESNNDFQGPPTLLAPPDEKPGKPQREVARDPLRRPADRIEPRIDVDELKSETRREARAGRAERKSEHRVEPRGDKAAREQAVAENIAGIPTHPPLRRRRRREMHEEMPPEPVAPPSAPEENLALEEPVEEPEFLRTARIEQEKRSFSVVYGGGSLLLAALLLVQLAVVFRTEITTRWPQSRPTVVEACKMFNCNVGWPARAELLAVVGTELQAIPGTDVLELTAIIRNRANFRVALPAIEVTLTDTASRTLARKVFAPVDYLVSSGEPSTRIDDGLGPNSDYTVHVAFEARGIVAVGFVVYPFYL